MTQQASVEIECPQCRTKQTTPMWSTINVDEDPDLKEKLFNGEINVFRCENCNYIEYLQVSLLYHDMGRGFLVWYFPLASLEDEAFLNNFTEQGVFSVKEMDMVMEGLSEEFKKVHVVFDMAEMVRYILFRDKLHEKWQGSTTKPS